MTHQGHGQFTCDECPEDIDTDARGFAEQKEALAAAGWRTFKGPDGEWAHACRACVAKFARRKR